MFLIENFINIYLLLHVFFLFIMVNVLKIMILIHLFYRKFVGELFNILYNSRMKDCLPKNKNNDVMR